MLPSRRLDGLRRVDDARRVEECPVTLPALLRPHVSRLIASSSSAGLPTTHRSPFGKHSRTSSRCHRTASLPNLPSRSSSCSTPQTQASPLFQAKKAVWYRYFASFKIVHEIRRRFEKRPAEPRTRRKGGRARSRSSGERCCSPVEPRSGGRTISWTL